MKEISVTNFIKIEVPIPRGEHAVTLTGRLEEYSSAHLHYHDCHQFIFIRDGVSLLIDEKMKQPLYGTMCAFIPSGFAHRTVVTGQSITYQSLYFKKNLPENKCTSNGIIIFRISELGRSLFNRMISKPDIKLSRRIQADVLLLFIKIAMEDMINREISLSLPEPVSPECIKLTGFIESSYMKKLSLDSFRAVLPFSTRHISRIFIKEMRMSVFDYLRIYRIIMASVLFQNREKSILEISIDCGYESLSAFYSDFSRYFSLTPGEFKKIMLKTD